MPFGAAGFALPLRFGGGEGRRHDHKCVTGAYMRVAPAKAGEGSFDRFAFRNFEHVRYAGRHGGFRLKLPQSAC
jgi:hypothetical protein